MKLSFDERGNLNPYKKIEISSKNFKEFFVDSFDRNSTRHGIFKRYEEYTQRFAQKITGNFRQWINGSFVSNKVNPKDIDLVTLIDYQIAEEKDDFIRNEFIKQAVLRNYGIDAYLIVTYPENHPLHFCTKSDLLYWSDWFTKSKIDRKRKRYPKGYIEINFKI